MDLIRICKQQLQQDNHTYCEDFLNQKSASLEPLGIEGQQKAAQILRLILNDPELLTYINKKGEVQNHTDALSHIKFLTSYQKERFLHPKLYLRNNNSQESSVISLNRALLLSDSNRPQHISTDFTEFCCDYFMSESTAKLLHRGFLTLVSDLRVWFQLPPAGTFRYPISVPGEILLSVVDFNFGQVTFQPGRHANLDIPFANHTPQIYEDFVRERRAERKRESLRRQFSPPFKIHLMVKPKYHLWCFFRIIRDIQNRLRERLTPTLTTVLLDSTGQKLKAKLLRLEKKIKRYKYRESRGISNQNRNLETMLWQKYIILEKLRYINGQAFPWDEYLDMGKTGFLYRNSLYRGGWGYPRKDPFPSFVLYPLKDIYLVPIIIHLEKIFSKSIRRQIGIPYHPFSNIKINAITYVSYGATEKRQEASREQRQGWLESGVTSLLRRHNKMPESSDTKWELPNTQRSKFVSDLLKKRFHYLE